MHIRATISASHPPLECAPVRVTPPSTVKSSRTATTPLPTMEPPHRSSSSVPSDLGAAFWGLRSTIVIPGSAPAHGQAQHHVGDHAGDRDIQPDGKGPARQLAVL